MRTMAIVRLYDYEVFIMRKKLVLTVAVLGVLGLSTTVHALDWDSAKSLFDTPTTNVNDEPVSDLENGNNNQAPGEQSEKLKGESEPNNSAESSDPIESGVEYIGQMFGPDDQDWFRIETTKNNEILTVQTAIANSLWLFTVRDRAGNILASSVNNDSDGVTNADATNPELADEFKMSVTVEKAGTYYIIVSPAPDAFGLNGNNSFQDFSQQTYHMEVTISDPTNPDNPVVDSNFNDLETEPNNGRDNPDPLASGKTMFGQLLRGGDEDWYEIQSPGNEIVEINFCGPLTPCAGQDNRIVMVLSKEFMDQSVQDALDFGSPIFVRNVEGSIGSRRYIEFLGEQGALGDALIGKIHPDFGSSNFLQIGIDRPGTYYFVVAGKLQRGANGAIDLNITTEEIPLADPATGEPLLDPITGQEAKRTIVTEGPFVVFEAFNDDQYALKITRTNLAPHTPGTPEFDAERERAKFDSATGIIHIPELEFNGSLFEAELIHRDADQNLYELLQLREIAQ